MKHQELLPEQHQSHDWIEQGDVCLTPEAIPKGLNKLNGNVVQEGEHTGHAHRLYDGDFELFECPKTKARHLRIITPTAFRHEEHKEIILPPGDYRIDIIQQWDYDTEESKRVID